jgi:sugar lactone lactonase YvrE
MNNGSPINHRKSKRIPAFCLLLGLLAAAFLPACAPVSALTRNPEGARIQWPPEPFPATIEWVKSIGNYRDAGITPGFWKKVADFLAGGEEVGIGRPYGVFFDQQRRLLIADPGFAVVQVMDLGKNKYFILGAGLGKPFQTPIGVTEDDGGNLYITDSAGGAVYRCRLQDRSLSLFARLKRPTGIAFNRRNHLLYVTDTLADQVVVFDLDGRERLRIGRRGEKRGRFNYPTDLFIDTQGTLFLTDPLNARVQSFTADGAFLQAFGQPGDFPGAFAKPKGIAVDSEGNIYVCDSLLDTVHVFDSAGTFLFDFGSRGSRPGEFWMPSGIYIDGSDRIYVSDTYNRRIQIFQHVRSDEAGK